MFARAISNAVLSQSPVYTCTMWHAMRCSPSKFSTAIEEQQRQNGMRKKLFAMRITFRLANLLIGTTMHPIFMCRSSRVCAP